ncbi:centromere protein X-like [Mytilus californianus]|uniref:centromere protein X-like n=1 Tax=Mytilus californianus TaxID=6549 RepID=UPI002247BFDC|nr:centromere protein X-like [Mytilus californianus]
MTEEYGALFKKKTIQCILQSFFKDEKTKMTNEAIHLSRELIGLFITEAIMRSCKEAEKDSTTTVSIEHLEKILPQLLLDF